MNPKTSTAALLLLALATPLRADTFEAALQRVQTEVPAQARAVKAALRTGDYDSVFRIENGTPYTLTLQVTAAGEPRAELKTEASPAYDSDTDRSFMICGARLNYPRVAVVTATLRNEATQGEQTLSENVTLTTWNSTWLAPNAACPAWDLSGKLKKREGSVEISLEIPDLHFKDMDILVLPFVTGLYTAENLDVSLVRYGTSYALKGFDFDALLKKAVDEKGAPRYQLGWRTDDRKNVMYVPLQKRAEDPSVTGTDSEDPYHLNGDPHECDEW